MQCKDLPPHSCCSYLQDRFSLSSSEISWGFFSCKFFIASSIISAGTALQSRPFWRICLLFLKFPGKMTAVMLGLYFLLKGYYSSTTEKLWVTVLGQQMQYSPWMEMPHNRLRHGRSLYQWRSRWGDLHRLLERRARSAKPGAMSAVFALTGAEGA